MKEAPMALPVNSGNWTLDATATEVAFTIKSMIFRTVPGRFDAVDGSATIGSDLAGSSISASVDATSFDTGNTKRDDHVKSDDFFDVVNNPTIRFESSAIRSAGSGFEVDGTLHAKSSAPITFTVTDVQTEGDAVRFVATGQVERAELGAGKAPSLMIGNVADITVRGRATPT
jgi:polyisoprenoid-binding protein YceI